MTADRLGLELEGQNALLNDGIIFPKMAEVNEFCVVSLRSTARARGYEFCHKSRPLLLRLCRLM